jgi:hypothetical protein
VWLVPDGIPPANGPSDNEHTKLEHDMITLDAFLVFLAAASLPVIYLLMVSRWIETEYRKTHFDAVTPQASPTLRKLVEKLA